MLQRAAGNAYSWWWASHIRTKQSKWLEQNLQDFEEKVQDTLKLIEEEGDSFAKRAEMYYKNRPELIVFVQEAFRTYRALAERYDHLSTELQKANTTIATVFPEQVQFAMEEEDEFNTLKNAKKLPQLSNQNVPKAPAGPVKELRNMFSNATKQFQPKPSTKKVTRTTSSSVKTHKSGLSKPEALGKIDKLQKEILVLQTEKEFLKSSYEHGVKKYRSIDKQIEEMQEEVFNLQDEFSDGMFIKDEEARSLMTSTALKSCQEALANLQEKHEKTSQETTAERARIRTTRQKLESLKDEFVAGGKKARSENKPSVEGKEELKSKQHEKELEMLRGEIKEHFEAGEGSCLTVTEMAEKVDELVEKVIGLETSFAGQTALVHRLRSETDELQAQIRTLESDKANLVSGSNNLISKLKEMEKKLKGIQELDQNIEDQNKNMQTHLTQVQCNLDHLSKRLSNVKSDEELEEKKPKKSKKESKAERKARKSSKNEENLKQDKESEIAASSQRDAESVKSQAKSEEGEAASLNISDEKKLEITGSSQTDKEPAKSQGPEQQKAASLNISDAKKLEITGSSQTDKEPAKSQEPKQQEAGPLNISDAKEREITGSSQTDKDKEPAKSQGPKQQKAASLNISGDKELEITGSSQIDKEPAKSLGPKQQEAASLNTSDNKELEITGSSQTGKEPAKSQGPKQQEAALLDISDDKKLEITEQEAAELNSCSVKKMKNSKPDKEVQVTGSLGKQEGPTGEMKLKRISNVREDAHIPGEGKDVVAEAEEGRKDGQVLSNSVINQRENGGLPKKTLNRFPPDKDIATLVEKAPDSPEEKSLASFLGIEAQEQQIEQDVDDEPNWRVLFLQGMENREKTLLAEYTTVLRNFKELKKQLIEIEKKSQDGLFETTLHLRKLKAANAMKDQEIKSLRQKLKHLQIMFESGELKTDLLQSPRSVGRVEEDEDEDMKYALEVSSHEMSETEEKFRGDIDALLEENLEFWLRFSTSFHQLQKYETEFEDLKADVSKLKIANRSEVNALRRNSLKSDARSLYKHLREIQTELTIWMEQSAQLKEELQSRFSSLCSIQEEITKALQDSARDEDFKFTSFQAAKFQGEILNMKQENNKVEDELQAGLDHVTSIQLQVEQCLTKLDYEFGIAGNQSNMQLAHCESRNQIPLSSFLFGVKPKKQKQSILACVSPALNKKYNNIKQGVLM